VIHSWTVRHKGPLYLAIFKPLSILIAVVMSAVFLNDSLYLGWYVITHQLSSLIIHIYKQKHFQAFASFCSLIGGLLITLGFYAVMWGKANEEKDQLLLVSGKERTPLLLNG